MLTVKIVNRVQQVRFEQQLAKEAEFELPEPELVLTADDLKCGKYYRDGDINGDYIQVNEDNTLLVLSEDLYGLFEKWNPDLPDVTQQLVEEYGVARPFVTEELFDGSLFIYTNVVENEETNEEIGGSGCRLVDYGKIKWDIEGDFIYLEDAQEYQSEAQ